jgi:hypothetical protein
MPAGMVPAFKMIFGVLKGRIRYPDDFDAPLPDDLLAQFEGRPGIGPDRVAPLQTFR